MNKIPSTSSIDDDWVCVIETNNPNSARAPTPPVPTDNSSSSIRAPTPPVPTNVYGLTAEEGLKTASFLRELAEKNFFQLGMSSLDLHRKGNELKTIHPMRFIGNILTNPDLSQQLEAIKRKRFTYARFEAGFVEHMREKSNDLHTQVDDFSAHLGVNNEVVRDIIRTRAYKDLIDIKRISLEKTPR
jgi:hypothetical protein